ncbi:hypothetical protein E2C01_080341 [Portunus trituberculatus]|uniref:Uncharacterized protein n=1 Tax=Portunus trituberculatus TaxID=210409 RepID=A0A5B7IJG1_PORTR|nr:hypothetical protein [Portunus trituberculatus]
MVGETRMTSHLARHLMSCVSMSAIVWVGVWAMIPATYVPHDPCTSVVVQMVAPVVVHVVAPVVVHVVVPLVHSSGSEGHVERVEADVEVDGHSSTVCSSTRGSVEGATCPGCGGSAVGVCSTW